MFTKVKTTQEIDAARESGAMLGQVLDYIMEHIEVGITTQALSDMASKELALLGGKPAFLGYQGFPEALCVSLNDEVVHGIPTQDRIIEDGDIVSFDFGVLYRGMITDAARSTIAGRKDRADVDLLKCTLASLHKGISQVKDGVRVGDIAHAVQSELENGGYGIVRDLVGHGVGHHVHEEPNIPNYGIAGAGPRLYAGMTIAIEPMATRGGHKVSVDADGWTIRTVDRSRSAHFENTVLITENGSEILTKTQS